MTVAVYLRLRKLSCQMTSSMNNKNVNLGITFPSVMFRER